MNFEFATATRILFGPGTVGQIGPLAAEMGRRAMLVVGAATLSSAVERSQTLVGNLAVSGVESLVFSVNSEPTIDLINLGMDQARREKCDLVIGFGGGSALDTSKAIAALLTNPGNFLDYLEVIGEGKPLTRPSSPSIAIPTTAGTGSEVTRNAVIGVPERRVKVSLRSPLMLPRLALVDPELTYSLPAHITASTGMDALTQLIEPYVSNRPNPITDALCREGMRRAARSLLRAYQNGNDPAAREDMSLASLFGGLALANSKLGAVHGFAAPLGGMLPAPHGAICACLLPYVMETNIRALQQRDPGASALDRYHEVAQILTENPAARASDGVAWVKELCTALQIPPLVSYGFTPADFPTLIQQAAKASSMQGNPIKLTEQEMGEILSRAL